MTKLGVVLASLLLLAGCGGSSGPGTGGGAGGGFGGGSGAGGGSSSCSASNCAGCCFNGACQAGSTAAACGKNGAACTACPSGNICSSNQTCVLDPQSRWRVVPASGTFVTSGNWDVGGGAPDGKVYLWCPATASATSLITFEESDNFNPTYLVSTGECVMTATDLQTIGFAIEVDDVDTTTNDIAMSRSTIKLSDGNFSTGTLTVKTQDDSCTVRLNVTRQ